MTRRNRESGFVIFAALFWTVVAMVIAIVSFLVPACKDLGCLSRVFLGFGGVIGLFVGGLSFGLVFPDPTPGLHQWSLCISMLLGAYGGAAGTASFTRWVESQL